MGNERSQFTFYASFAKAAERIRKKSDRCDFYDIVKDYALYGKVPDLEHSADSVAIAFELIKPNLDVSKRKSEGGKARSSQHRRGEDTGKNQTRQKQDSGKTQARQKQDSGKEKERENEVEKELENDSSPPLSPLTGGSQALKDAFADWLEYKREKRDTYKPTGLKALETQVLHAAEEYGNDAVVQLIRECMANNWRGIIFDRLKQAGGGRSSKNGQSASVGSSDGTSWNGYKIQSALDNPKYAAAGPRPGREAEP